MSPEEQKEWFLTQMEKLLGKEVSLRRAKEVPDPGTISLSFVPLRLKNKRSLVICGVVGTPERWKMSFGRKDPEEPDINWVRFEGDSFIDFHRRRKSIFSKVKGHLSS